MIFLSAENDLPQKSDAVQPTPGVRNYVLRKKNTPEEYSDAPLSIDIIELIRAENAAAAEGGILSIVREQIRQGGRKLSKP